MHHGHERPDVRRALCAAAVALALGLTGPAFAEDGVIEINRARATAGGITTGDAPGWPVTISVPGSYRLTGALDVSGEAPPAAVTVILVTADHVTLDLNGFAILGPTRCTVSPPSCAPVGAGRGIDAREATDVTVTNGGVRGMGSDGIRLGTGGVVRHVMAQDNAGVGIGTGDFSLVTESVSALNGGGLEVGFGSVVVGNAAGVNGDSGVQLDRGSVAHGNATSFNLAHGIAAAAGSSVRGNAAYSNGGYGLSLTGVSGYAGNVLVENAAGTVLGGLETDANLCASDTTCP